MLPFMRTNPREEFVGGRLGVPALQALSRHLLAPEYHDNCSSALLSLVRRGNMTMSADSIVYLSEISD
jgi:hypothetical protein